MINIGRFFEIGECGGQSRETIWDFLAAINLSCSSLLLLLFFFSCSVIVTESAVRGALSAAMFIRPISNTDHRRSVSFQARDKVGGEKCSEKVIHRGFPWRPIIPDPIITAVPRLRATGNYCLSFSHCVSSQLWNSSSLQLFFPNTGSSVWLAQYLYSPPPLLLYFNLSPRINDRKFRTKPQ